MELERLSRKSRSKELRWRTSTRDLSCAMPLIGPFKTSSCNRRSQQYQEVISTASGSILRQRVVFSTASFHLEENIPGGLHDRLIQQQVTADRAKTVSIPV